MKATLFAVSIGLTALVGIPTLAAAQASQGVQNNAPPPPYYYNGR
jgi:hypothetical protein